MGDRERNLSNLKKTPGEEKESSKGGETSIVLSWVRKGREGRLCF